MKVTIEINVPEGPARDAVLGNALEQCWRDIGNAVYEAKLEGHVWEHYHIPIHDELNHCELIGHIDLSTKEST